MTISLALFMVWKRFAERGEENRSETKQGTKKTSWPSN